MKIAIVILNFNNAKDTIECLKSIRANSQFDAEIKTFIIDNCSRNEDIKLLKINLTNETLIENKINQGYAEGNNIGIKLALKNGCGYILLLNNDVILAKDFLKQLIKIIRINSQIQILSPKIYFAPGYEFHKTRYKQKDLGRVIWYAGGIIDWQNILPSHRGVNEVDMGQYDETTKTDFATGCCILVNKEVFNHIDLFDKRYFLYWEDIDFCERAKRQGYKIFYTGKAYLWHKNASSSGGAGAKTSIYYQTRNRLLFAFTYASLRSKIALLKESIRLLLIGEDWQKKAIWDFFILKFGQLKE